MKVFIKNFNTKKWLNYNGIHVIGWALHKGKMLKQQALAEFFLTIDNETDLCNVLKELDGNFGVVLNTVAFSAIAIDRWAGIPLIYNNEFGDLELVDKIDGTFEVNSFAIQHFEYLACTPCNQTIYKDWNALKAGGYLFLNDKKEWISKRYFIHQGQRKLELSNEMCSAALRLAYEHLQDYLSGRRAVVPLSAGQDAQLILTQLVENGYSNILCFTYGSEKDKDVMGAKALCKALKVEWIFVPYNRDVLSAILSDDWMKYEMQSHQGISLPYDQDFFAIKYLTNKGLIYPEEDVILPGFLGDHLAGSFHVFQREQPTKKQIIEALCNKFLIDKIPSAIGNHIWQYISDPIYVDVLSGYQDWLSVHRHARFICGGWKAYDYFGFDSYIFAASNAWTDFWYGQAWKSRHQQQSYNSFCKKQVQKIVGHDFKYVKDESAVKWKGKLKKHLPSELLRLIKSKRNALAEYEKILLDILTEEGQLDNFVKHKNFNVAHSEMFLRKILT